MVDRVLAAHVHHVAGDQRLINLVGDVELGRGGHAKIGARQAVDDLLGIRVVERRGRGDNQINLALLRGDQLLERGRDRQRVVEPVVLSQNRCS